MNIHALVRTLDETLDVHAFPDGQHNGLQVEGTRDVQRIACAVSVSMETIEGAIAAGADVLLTHHGLLWHNQPLHVQGVRRSRLARLLASGIHLVSYHLPLDAHPIHGNNAALAEAAGCRGTQRAFPMKGSPVGMVGRLPEPVDFSAWRRDFEAALRQDCEVDTGPFQVWPFGDEQVETIGLLSGAAPYQVQDAIDMGLDVYVTGETTEGAYHLAKEAGIHFIGGGHYLTERLGVQRLGTWLETEQGLEHVFVESETRA